MVLHFPKEKRGFSFCERPRFYVFQKKQRTPDGRPLGVLYKFSPAFLLRKAGENLLLTIVWRCQTAFR